MPSSSAVIAALASALVGLHRSGLFDLESPSAPVPAPARPCRVFADDRRGAVEEGLIVLSDSPHAHYIVVAVLVFSVIGVVTVIYCAVDICCASRAPQSVHWVLSHGEGANRQIARR